MPLKGCTSTFSVPHMYHTAVKSCLMNFRMWKIDNTFSSLSCHFRLGTVFNLLSRSAIFFRVPPWQSHTAGVFYLCLREADA